MDCCFGSVFDGLNCCTIFSSFLRRRLSHQVCCRFGRVCGSFVGFCPCRFRDSLSSCSCSCIHSSRNSIYCSLEIISSFFSCVLDRLNCRTIFSSFPFRRFSHQVCCRFGRVCGSFVGFCPCRFRSRLCSCNRGRIYRIGNGINCCLEAARSFFCCLIDISRFRCLCLCCLSNQLCYCFTRSIRELIGSILYRFRSICCLCQSTYIK